ncbi:TonB-dependent receptor [Methylophaga lonarensis MPL]|uniref:TonB-dependent receptor n=2 Tax=Methylophaga lonarensis TaxID=999151 RepID=M7PIV6_9GAMM|nr:TonB-dependent receptor [Methylophaga lonarensis MPL]
MNKQKTLYWMMAIAIANSPVTWAETQDESVELSTLVVSSKRSTELEKLDVETKIISKETLEKTDVQSLDGLNGLAPGLSILQRGARIYNNISLRGQSSMDFYVPNVLVYVDGLVQDQGTLGQALPIATRQVEVLNGPQGTLYGRGAVGGVINIITDKPGEGKDFELSTSQSNLKQMVSGRVNQALGDSGLFFDLSGHYLDEDGEYKGLLSGKDLGDSLNKQIQGRLRWAPENSPWDVMLSLRHDEIRSSEEQYVPESDFSRRRAFPVENEYSLRLDSYGLIASYDFDKVKVSSLTSYQGRDFNRVVFSQASPESQKTITQELRITSLPSAYDTFSYLAGLYYEDTDFSFARPGSLMESNQTMETMAAFGEATWYVTDKLDITTGLRLDRNKVKADASFAGITNQGSDTFYSTSPKLVFGYQLTPETRVYALYSEGSKSGGFTRVSTPAIVNQSYDAQKVRNYEMGIKTRMLDERLWLSAATYFTKTDDYQLYLGFAPNQYLDNIGETEVKGISFDSHFAATDRLNLFAMWAYSKAEFTDYDATDTDLKGNATPYVPRSTANVGLEYDLPVPQSIGKLSFHTNALYTGTMYFDQENVDKQSSYTLWNAGLRWQPQHNVNVDLYGNNLSNKDYAVYMFNGGPGLGNLYQLGRGREIGVKLTLSY